ncbi:MAG: PrsW family glutamic-type intramembrane protease [Bacillota bacterium]|nr:PrsW family glutamic-type intramembrane protease [Bacillota bacterium]
MLNNFDSNGIALKPVKRNRFWLKTLIIGFTIYIATIIAFVYSNNPNLFPTIVLVGNFLVPVSFVSFFYERRANFHLSILSTALCFFYGGILGTITASILEPYFIHDLTFSTSFMVGVIEESTKMIGVLLIAGHGKHKSAMTGLILGAAAGMGFAAFESTGYAFNVFLQSGGSLSEVVAITLIRGIISPVGHGTWSAILASVLLRESGPRGYNINSKVVGAFLVVVILHGLWDGLPFVMNRIFPVLHSVFIGQLTIGVIGLVILYRRWREAVEPRQIVQHQ